MAEQHRQPVLRAHHRVGLQQEIAEQVREDEGDRGFEHRLQPRGIVAASVHLARL